MYDNLFSALFYYIDEIILISYVVYIHEIIIIVLHFSEIASHIYVMRATKVVKVTCAALVHEVAIKILPPWGEFAKGAHVERDGKKEVGCNAWRSRLNVFILAFG